MHNKLNQLLLCTIVLIILLLSCSKSERRVATKDINSQEIKTNEENTSDFKQESICLFIDLSVPMRGYYKLGSRTMNILKKIWDNSLFTDLNYSFDRDCIYGFGSDVIPLSLNNINEILDKFSMASSNIKVVIDFIKNNKEGLKCNSFLIITDLIVSQKAGTNDVSEYAKSLRDYVSENDNGLWLVGTMTEYFGVTLKKSRGLFYFSETKDHRGGWVKMDSQITKPLYYLLISRRNIGRKMFLKLRENMMKIYDSTTAQSVEIYPHNIDNDKLGISCIPNPKNIIIANSAKYYQNNEIFENEIKMVCKSEKPVTLNCFINSLNDNFEVTKSPYSIEFVYDKTYIDISVDYKKIESTPSPYYLPIDLNVYCNKIEVSYSKAKSGNIKVNLTNKFKDNVYWWDEWSTEDDFKEYTKTLYFSNLMRNLLINSETLLRSIGEGIEFKIWR